MRVVMEKRLSALGLTPAQVQDVMPIIKVSRHMMMLHN